MPRITNDSVTNADTNREPPLFRRQGHKDHAQIPPRLPADESTVEQDEKDQEFEPDALEAQDHGDLHILDGGDSPSAGTSSSTSERKQGPSGSNPQGTDPSTQSPAQSAESLSSQDQQSKPAQSSTAPSTSGSSPETGQDQVPQPDSSEESAKATQATPDTTRRPPRSKADIARANQVSADAKAALHLAREAFDNGEYDAAEDLLKEASADSSLDEQIQAARADIAQKRGQS
jgi:hypothetical protein